MSNYLFALAALSLATGLLTKFILCDQNECNFLLLFTTCFNIFFAPGIFICRIFKLSSKTFLQELCKAMVLSLATNSFLALLVFCLRENLNMHVKLFLLIQLVLCILSTRKSTKQWRPLGYYEYGVIVMAICFSYVAYNWGTSLLALSGEKLLGLMFCRYYFEMPLAFNSIGIWPGLPPKNMLNLWEFFIAQTASISNTDLITVFFRFRLIIPLLGIISFFWLLEILFKDKKKLLFLAFSCLLSILLGPVLQSPSSWNWIVKEDPLRWVCVFLGSVHHSDSAMDILLPLGCAFTLNTLKKPKFSSLLFYFAFSWTALLWHAREFFQTCLYLGVACMVLFYLLKNKSLALRCSFFAFIPLISSAILFLILTNIYSPGPASGFDEASIKMHNLTYLKTPEIWYGFRNMYQIPFHAMITSTANPDLRLEPNSWQKYLKNQAINQPEWSSYLFLMGACLPFLILSKNKIEKGLGLYVSFLWLGALCWDVGIQFVSLATYSEFYMSTPRLIYLFFYIIVPTALWKFLSSNKSKYTFLALVIISLLYKYWIWAKQPCADGIGVLITICVLAALLKDLFKIKNEPIHR